MRTIEKNVCQFSELSEEAKEKALSNLIDINVSHDWWIFTYDDAAGIGLKLESFDLDRNRHCTGVFTLAAEEVAQNILNNHGEKCGTYLTARNFLEEWRPIFANYMDETHEYDDEREIEGIKKGIQNVSATNKTLKGSYR